MRLDNAVWKYTYDPAWRGHTVYLKLQSYNVYGNAAQNLADVAPITLYIPGLNRGTIDGSSGNIGSNSLPPNVPTNVANNCTITSSWVPVGGGPFGGYASIDGYGPGGSTSAWAFQTASGISYYPAFGMTHMSGGTTYAVLLDTQTMTYFAVLNLADALADYCIFIGYVKTATASDSPINGGGGTTGGACTAEGTMLDTPDGPLDNRDVKRRFDAGEAYLTGRFGPERVLIADWVESDDIYKVRVGTSVFECSGTHMLRVAGHYRYTKDLVGITVVETRTGYAQALITKAEPKRVLLIHLAGPSHEYSSHGVITHNVKAPPVGSGFGL
jgi:hypothetical protein